jgi:hypothetical protein
MKLLRCLALANRLLLLMLLMSGWVRADDAPVFEFPQVPPPSDRLHVHTQEQLRVTTAVPSADEAKAVFGVKLYKHDVQPIWIQIENLGDQPLLLMPMGLDPDYYSPVEAAYRTLGQQALDLLLNRQAVDLAMHQQRMTLLVMPHSIRSGYIFSRVDEGTKSFNVDVLGGDEPYTMSFFVPVPGLRVDHLKVDELSLYGSDELVEVDLAGLVAGLEALPCCVTDKDGVGNGDPLNIAFVGSIEDIWYAFMRAGWDESETIYGSSLMKMAFSSIVGTEYRYSPVSALYVFGRAQGVSLQRARSSINERNHLRLWRTPMRYEGMPIWIGQISRDIGVRFTAKTITTHKIDPDVDETREFLIEDLAYSQSLEKFGYVRGVGVAAYDEPRGNLTGDPYFTDGQRAVMWLSRNQHRISDIDVLDLHQYSSHPDPDS